MRTGFPTCFQANRPGCNAQVSCSRRRTCGSYGRCGVATASRVRVKRKAPDPSATPPRIRARPRIAFRRQRLVQDRHAVGDGERRDQVRDERGARGAVRPEHPEEEAAARTRSRRCRARRPSASAFALGVSSGSWKSASGARIRKPASDEPVDEHRAATSPCSGPARTGSPPRRRARRARPRASRRPPTSRPPGGTRRARATPRKPRMIPTSRRPETRSLGRNLIASSATKIGTGAFAIPAIDESTCCSPQAISVNGSAVLISPRTTSPQPGGAQVGDRVARLLAGSSGAARGRARRRTEPERHERHRARSRPPRP